MRKKIWFILLCAATLLCASATADTLIQPTSVMAIEAEAFMGDTSLDEAELPEGLLSIGSRAFAQSSLKRIYLPKSLSDIAADAFLGCQGLTAWGYPGTAGEAFCQENGIVYEALSTPVEQFTFSFPNDTEATVTGWNGEDDTVIIPEMADATHRVTAIGDNAFREKNSIIQVFLPTGLETIDTGAFYGCANLTDVVFHEGINTIHHAAFAYCEKLREADLPDSVTTIGVGQPNTHGAFQGCTALERFHYPASLTNAAWARYGSAFKDCPNFKTVEFGAGTTVIAPNIFAEANSLEEIDLPDTVTFIGDSAFRNNTGISVIYIPVSVSNITQTAFLGHDTALEIWCEYGSAALEFAQNNSINYYYLSLAGNNRPRVVYQGDAYSLLGSVVSNYTLTNVSALLVNAGTGAEIVNFSVDPQSGAYPLYGEMSNRLNLGNLPLGSYQLTLSGSTAKSAETFYTAAFQVKEPPVRINTDQVLLPVFYVYPFEYMRLSGTLSSNYPITDVYASLENESTGEVKVYTAQPNTKSLDLDEIAQYFGRFAAEDISIYWRFVLRITVHGETETLCERRITCCEPETAPNNVRLDPLFSRGIASVNGPKRAFWSMRLANEIYSSAQSFAKDAWLRDYRKVGDPALIRCGLMWKDMENTDGTYNRLWVIGVEGTIMNSVDQWLSNLDMGSSSFHYGFMEAAEAVMSYFQEYRSEIEFIRPRAEGKTYMPDRVWVTGHSRGAAVANILGGKLLADAGFAPNDIYAACFACPSVLKTDQESKIPRGTVEVYNISGDIVPALPLIAWGYGSYGSISLFTGSIVQNLHFGTREVNQWEDIESLIDLLSGIPERSRLLLVAAIQAYWETSCPQSLADALQGALDTMMMNSANNEIIPTSTLGKLEWVYEIFTGHASFFKRLINSHNNETYYIWMYDRYPNADSTKYYLN